jgi:thiol-disulfide isomerase/thioredoxin
MSETGMPQPLSTPSRIWWYVVIGGAIFWALYLNIGLPGPRKLLENTGMSTPASYDWSLVDLNDQPVKFSRFKNKTIFLNIWATWCGPCLGEMPSIDKLARNPRFQGKNIEFVCVSTDDSTEAVRRYVADKNWSMTVLRAGQIPSVFYSEGIPATFVIAPDGRIAGFEVGAADWSEPHVVEFLEKLATHAPPGAVR